MDNYNSPIPSAAPDGFRRVDRSASLLRANFLMVYFAVPSVLLLGGMYVWLWGYQRILWLLTSGEYLFPLALILLGIVVHEAIHGVTWKLAAGLPFSAITFGFDWKTITPYAHCKDAMLARPYRIGAVMPLLLLGVLPSLIAIAQGQGGLIAFGLFFTFAAGGDMLILWLLRDIPSTALVEDHPTRAGCYVLFPEEKTSETLGIPEIRESDSSMDG